MDMKKILSLPKSIYYNIKLFGWRQAITLPIIFSKNCKFFGLRRGCVKLNNHSSRVTVGFYGSNGVEQNKHTLIYIGEKGYLQFNGCAVIGAGSSLRIDNGTLTIGDNFSCNKNCFISCTKSISFGNDCLLGWNINIRDSDGHSIFDADGTEKPSLKEVIIGNHVWIASNVNILKGTIIGNNSVVGFGSMLTKEYKINNVIIAGNPAKIVQNNVSWKM